MNELLLRLLIPYATFLLGMYTAYKIGKSTSSKRNFCHHCKNNTPHNLGTFTALIDGWYLFEECMGDGYKLMSQKYIHKDEIYEGKGFLLSGKLMS